MSPITAGFVLDLVPHCEPVPRDGWVGDQGVRPLNELGHRQAATLAVTLGAGVDGVYSSPALRCRQTVEPTARAAGLEVVVLDGLAEAAGFTEPSAWIGGTFADIAGPLGGGWTTGLALDAVRTMADRHPGGRVVASSHGDVIPLLVAAVCAAGRVPVPDVVYRGGWYRLRFGADGAVTVDAHPA